MCVLGAVSTHAMAAENLKATIRTTSHGVAHVSAADVKNVGFGIGYAQAKEVICDIAQRNITVNGERSLYFGADNLVPDGPSRPTNLDSDFFWQRVKDAAIVRKEMAAPVPVGPGPELRALVQGFVAGYNKYIVDVGVANIPDKRCRGAEWVRSLTEEDVYLRAMHWNLFRSGVSMITQLAAATPPVLEPQGMRSSQEKLTLLEHNNLVADARGEGSNMMAFGAETTDNGMGMLHANPHWTWQGPDRWIEMHFTVPGTGINVIGMQTIGLPVIQTGFNPNVAWAGTSSTPIRYTLYKLKLSGPTTYVVDGKEREITSRVVRVRVRDAAGKVRAREHRFWETQWGMMVSDPERPWTETSAYAVRDVGYTFRWLSQQFRLNQSTSVEDLSDSSAKFMAIGWRNIQAADKFGTVLYADRTAIPAVTDELLDACVADSHLRSPGSRGLTLDGTRSSCAWATLPGAPVPGIFPASSLTRLVRKDYVLQSNDSQWLNNLHEPIENSPKVMGSTRTARSLRTRNALSKVENRLAGKDGYPGNKFTLNLLKTITQDNRVYSADVWVDDVIALCRAQTQAEVQEACHAIESWDRTDNVGSGGAMIWRRFVENLQQASDYGKLFAVPFDVKNPIYTPAGLRTDDPKVLSALKAAIADLKGAGIPVAASLRNYQYAVKGDRHIPIPGGPGPTGQYNVLETGSWVAGKGYGPVHNGASFMMWMQFTPAGPVGESILTFSQSPNPDSPYFADQTAMWSDKITKRMLFEEKDILGDPNLETQVVCSRATCR